MSSFVKEARFHARWVFLTYAKCSMEEKDEFKVLFVAMLRRNGLINATYYGCREEHKVEGIHYHVLLHVGKQVNWSFKYARQCFTVGKNECESLHLSTPRSKQSLVQFVENHVLYCEKEKGGDCFGKRPSFSSEKKEDRKRKWEEIGSQVTAPAKLARLD